MGNDFFVDDRRSGGDVGEGWAGGCGGETCDVDAVFDAEGDAEERGESGSIGEFSN